LSNIVLFTSPPSLLAGEIAVFAELNAKPALVLSTQQKSTELDDGLLTASEVARLKFDAEWVALFSGDTSDAELLSGSRPCPEPRCHHPRPAIASADARRVAAALIKMAQLNEEQLA
jgi:hypothetical protein